MDGPTIAAATEAALDGGVRVRDTLSRGRGDQQGRWTCRGDDLLEPGVALGELTPSPAIWRRPADSG